MSRRLRQSNFLAKKDLLAAILEDVTAGDKGRLWQVQKQGIPLKVFRGSLGETPCFHIFVLRLRQQWAVCGRREHKEVCTWIPSNTTFVFFLYVLDMSLLQSCNNFQYLRIHWFFPESPSTGPLLWVLWDQSLGRSNTSIPQEFFFQPNNYFF